MATAPKSTAEKFCNFVNKRIGKELTSTKISSGTRVCQRSVQNYCKKVRNTKKCTVGKKTGSKSFVYCFVNPIAVSDLVKTPQK